MNRFLISEWEEIHRGFPEELILLLFVMTFPHLVIQAVGQAGSLSVQNVLLLSGRFVQSLLDLRNDVELFIFLLRFVRKN